MRDHDKINDEPESARTDVALKGAPQAQEDENGVFPASVWVVEPSKFMAQLTSPYECFIRLIWAPLLFCFATYAQWVVMEEMEIWGLAAFVFTLPAICWSLAAILFTTEYRKNLTCTFVEELPALGHLGASGFEVLYLLIKGFFHGLRLLITAIFHALT